MGSYLWLPAILFGCTVMLYMMAASIIQSIDYKQINNATSQNTGIKFPSSIEDIKHLADLFHSISNQKFHLLVVFFIAAYLYKQTFAIPGSVFLNILAGSLFGPWVGLAFCCCLSAFGASNCFLLSKYFARDFLLNRFPDRITQFQQMIGNRTSLDLFCYLLSLRLLPMTPNWLLNMASPIVGVPIWLFFPSVLFGLIPYNLLCVQAGCILGSIRSVDDVFNWAIALKLLPLAVIALIPTIGAKLLKSRQVAQEHLLLNKVKSNE